MNDVIQDGTVEAVKLVSRARDLMKIFSEADVIEFLVSDGASRPLADLAVQVVQLTE